MNRLTALLVLALLLSWHPWTAAAPAASLSRPLFLALEADGSVVVTDEGIPGIARVKRSTGSVELVSSGERGTGPGFQALQGIAVAPDGELAVVDGDLPGVIGVDPRSGNRWVLSGPGRGGGPAFAEPVGIAFQAGHFYVTDAGRGAVVRVDRDSGERAVVASRESGAPFSEPHGIAVTPQGQVVVADPGISTLFVIAPGTGRVRVVASPDIPSGVRLGELRGVAARHDGRVVVSDGIYDHLLQIDLSSGRAVPLSAAGLQRPEGVQVLAGGDVLVACPDQGALLRLSSSGDASPFSMSGRPAPGLEPRGLDVLPGGDFVLVDRAERSITRLGAAGGRVLIADGRASDALQAPHSVKLHARAGIVLTDENTASLLGVRDDASVYTISRAGVRGRGPAMLFPNGLAVESEESVVVADEGLPGVVRIRLADGERSLVSANGRRGRGPAFDSPTGIAVTRGGDIVVAEDMLGALLRIDPRSGDRTVLSRAGVRGLGSPFAIPFAVAVDVAGGLLVVDDGQDALYRVDADSGDRLLISGQGRGKGRDFRSPIDVVPVSGRRAAVLDAGLDAVVYVDLETGDRSVRPLAAWLGR